MASPKFTMSALMVLSSLFISNISFAKSYVAGANYSNGRLYAVCFEPGSNGEGPRISANTVDGGLKPVSLAFYSGKADELGKEQLQLLSADLNGQIKRFNWGEQTTIGTEPQGDCNNLLIEPVSPLFQYSNFGPASPNGLAVVPDNKLIVLSTGSATSSGGQKKQAGQKGAPQKGSPKGTQQSASEIWSFDLLNAGAAPQLIMGNLPFANLEETLLLPSSLSSTGLHNDLLIVANNPSVIFKVDKNCYLNPGSCNAGAVQAFIGGNSGVDLPGDPAGVALLPAPNQDKLLVSLSRGRIALYDISSGQAVLEDRAFVRNLASGKFKIKTLRDVTLAQGSALTVNFKADVFVAGRNNGSIVKISVSEQNGELLVDPDFVQVAEGVEHAVGIAANSDDFVRIGDCIGDCPDKITVNISNVIEHDFDFSEQTGEPLQGYIGETFTILKDPRPGCDSDNIGAVSQILYFDQGQFYLNDPATVNTIQIPAHLCGSPAYDPHIMVITNVNNIDVKKSVLAHKAYTTDFDGDGQPDLDCFSSDLTLHPAFGWAPIPNSNEQTISEGNQVVDLMVGCGSQRMLTRNLSYFIVGLRNQLFPITVGGDNAYSASQIKAKYAEIFIDELEGFKATLNEALNDNGGQCVANANYAASLAVNLNKMQLKLSDQDYYQLDLTMLNILNQLRDNDTNLGLSPKDSGCSKNFRGDTLARASHLFYGLATKLANRSWIHGCDESINIEACLN